jgi:hypothetical protein
MAYFWDIGPNGQNGQNGEWRPRAFMNARFPENQHHPAGPPQEKAPENGHLGATRDPLHPQDHYEINHY